MSGGAGFQVQRGLITCASSVRCVCVCVCVCSESINSFQMVTPEHETKARKLPECDLTGRHHRPTLRSRLTPATTAAHLCLTATLPAAGGLHRPATLDSEFLTSSSLTQTAMCILSSPHTVLRLGDSASLRSFQIRFRLELHGPQIL